MTKNETVPTSGDPKFAFEAIPRRVFLDTNVVNCLVKWGECIFESEEPPSGLDATLLTDIASLTRIFVVGRRANWDIVVSDKTIQELSETLDNNLRNRLLNYGDGLIEYSTTNGVGQEDHQYASDLARRLVDSPFLAPLPDASDRELVAHAIALNSDAFCTLDRRSIHRKRRQLRLIPLRILTPDEWWQHISPWAALWI
jgi:hypothetical protein